jgi:hypothetical protein
VSDLKPRLVKNSPRWFAATGNGAVGAGCANTMIIGVNIAFYEWYYFLFTICFQICFAVFCYALGAWRLAQSRNLLRQGVGPDQPVQIVGGKPFAIKPWTHELVPISATVPTSDPTPTQIALIAIAPSRVVTCPACKWIVTEGKTVCPRCGQNLPLS